LQSSNPYFKAKFVGLFKRQIGPNAGIYVFSDIQWTYLNITECNKIEKFDPYKHKTGDYWYKEKIAGSGFNWFRPKADIVIPKNIEEAYNGSLYNVIIKNLQINKEKTHFLYKDWFEATGDIYFLLNPLKAPAKKKVVENKPAPVVVQSQNNDPIVVAVPIDNNVSGTNVIQNAIIRNNAEPRATTVRVVTPDVNLYNTNSGTAINQNTTINNQGSNSGGCLKGLGTIFGFIVFALFLISLWSTSKILFAILLFSGLSWLLSRLFNNSLLKSILNILLLVVLLGFIFSFFYKTSSTKKPVKTRSGNIKINPPVPKKDSTGNNLTDYVTEKDIKWFDFINYNYQAKYETSVRSYQGSQQEQTQINNIASQSTSSIKYFTKYYSGLYTMDEGKINEIVKIFKDSAVKKKMNPNQTAEMVITFIQEIPYYLVHDESCAKSVATGNSFVKEYHAANKPCLPNVKGGVQSPYEFLHNLKGDCDTRSLLGYAILKKLNIAASVWVSEAYGHSIMGVGVQNGHGIYKIVNGIKHYGVELTAKGYRLGMVAPENNNPYNWDITVYNNY
jgi:hypothetical protein